MTVWHMNWMRIRLINQMIYLDEFDWIRWTMNQDWNQMRTGQRVNHQRMLMMMMPMAGSVLPNEQWLKWIHSMAAIKKCNWINIFNHKYMLQGYSLVSWRHRSVIAVKRTIKLFKCIHPERGANFISTWSCITWSCHLSKKQTTWHARNMTKLRDQLTLIELSDEVWLLFMSRCCLDGDGG